jgi:methionine--tRNA ligase beta chain
VGRRKENRPKNHPTAQCTENLIDQHEKGAVEKSMESEKTQSPPETPESPEITFDDFLKLDLRVGKILEVIPVEKSKKLMRVMVDFGTEKRQAVAGLAQYYKPEELVGKKCVFLVNLKRRMLAGFESQCMILAAEDEQGVVSVLHPEKDVAEGAKIG